MQTLVEFPKAFPLESLHIIKSQLDGKLNDRQMARLAGWNLIGFGLSMGAELGMASYNPANANEDDASVARLFERSIEAVERSDKAAAAPFPWEQLGPVVWHLIHRWRV